MTKKRSEPLQPPLPFADEEREVLGLIAGVAMRVADHHGRAGFADRIGMSESAANHALNRSTRGDGRRVSVIPIEKLAAVVRLPGGEALVEYLASLIGCQLVAAAPPSAEEELQATDQVLSQMFGREVMDTFRTMRRKQVATNRGVRLAGGPRLEVVK